MFLRNVIKEIVHVTWPGNTPDFILVGAQKAGTSSLHSYLNQHPNIIGSRPKEVRFFDNEENYAKGLKWYRRAFKDVTKPFKKGIYFEATPEYMYRSKVAERMHEFNPDMKIVMILREPVARSFSAWNMYRDFPIKFKKLPGGLDRYDESNKLYNLIRELYDVDEFPSFEETFISEQKKMAENSDLEEPSFFRRGIYLPQIKKYHDLFGHENVLVLGFSDLLENKRKVLNQVLVHMGMEESDWSFLDEQKKNYRSYPVKMEDSMKEKLIEFYKPYNEELFDYLSFKPNW